MLFFSIFLQWKLVEYDLCHRLHLSQYDISICYFDRNTPKCCRVLVINNPAQNPDRGSLALTISH